MSETMVRLVRPTETLYRCIGKVIEKFGLSIYDMPKYSFIGAVMKEGNGILNPSTIQDVYYTLMKEAGIKHETSPIE